MSRESRDRPEDHPSPSPGRGRPGSILRWLIVLLVAMVGASLLGLSVLSVRAGGMQPAIDAAIRRMDAPASADSHTVRFVIQPGESAQRIAERLQAEGLIRSALWFRLLAHYYGVAGGLQAGEYELRPNMTSSEILSHLNHGLVMVTEITIPEGWRQEEIAEALSRAGIFDKQGFLSALNGSYAYDFLRSKPADTTLEGYLFPDTYRLAPGAQPADFVDQMLRDFDRRFSPSLRRQAEARGLTIHQVVTLASIVEREAAVPDERPLIAAVFLNRLRLGMRLDADPTVQYALGSVPESVARYGYWKRGLTRDDLAVESPYNTYRHTGLPPGPIGNPGLASIRAVLQPASTDYLYFVAKGDGTHAFAATLEQHLENVQRFSR